MDSEAGVSDRSGEDHLPDLRRQVQYTLETEQLHVGLSSELLIQGLLNTPISDLMGLPLSDSDQGTIAGILLREDEPLTLELLEGALEALRRRHLEREKQHVQALIRQAEQRKDNAGLAQLVQQKLKIDRALAAR